MYRKGKETGVDEIPGIPGEFPEVLRQRAVRMIKSFLGLWFLISQYHFLKQKAIILSVRTATPAKILRFFTAAQYQKNLKNPRFPEKMHKISKIFHFSACIYKKENYIM